MSHHPDRGDCGDASTQLVLLTPVLLLLVLLVVQLGLWLHASNVGAAAASRGVAAASVLDGSAAGGVAAATELADDAGARLASTPVVERRDGVVTARVEVRLRSLLPGLPRTVTRVAVGPIERFVPEPER